MGSAHEPRPGQGLRLLTFFVLTAITVAYLASTAQADHGKGAYKMPALAYWDEANLDVLVVPPSHGQLYNDDREALNGGDPAELTPNNTYLKAIEAAIEEWRQGVRVFGSRALKHAFKLDVYVLGTDDVPQDVLTNPDIIVVNDEVKPSVLGVAIKQGTCVANTSKIDITGSFTYADMFNIVIHEFGHCLGLQHIGEYADPWDEHPPHDVMLAVYPDTVGSAGTHLHCVSNLNVAGLEYVFSTLTGSSEVGSEIGADRDRKVVSIPEKDYRTTCYGSGDATTAFSTPQQNGEIRRAPLASRIFITVTGRVSGVEVAVRQKTGSTCKWWDSSTDVLIEGACNQPLWLDAVNFVSPGSYETVWQRTVPSSLPAGKYQAYARALDESAAYVERCCEKGRNFITFQLL